jgi:hypothetical protein
MHLLRQVERRRGVETQGPRGNPVQLAAILVECGRARGAQHARRGLDGTRLSPEPIVHDGARAQQAAHVLDAVDHLGRIEPLVTRLRQLLSPRGQELLAQRRVPGQRSQHAQRLGEVVEQPRRGAVAMISFTAVPAHRSSIA